MIFGMSGVYAIIPARAGSKSVPDKNIRLFCGKPLLVHSIKHALQSLSIDRTIVSTDSEEYAEIARNAGAEVPFLRPAEIAQDDSSDLEAFQHALFWLQENENSIPGICVHLRPTYPMRKVEDIDHCIQILLDSPQFDSVRTVVPVTHPPYKMWFLSDDHVLTPVVKTDIKDAHNLPRQILPPTFLQNACIDVVRTSVILEKKSMTGDRIYGYRMEECFDIDTEKDMQEAAGHIAKKVPLIVTGDKRTVCCDIDGVLASIVKDNQYDKAWPLQGAIDAINRLYDSGYHILLYTARGTKTGIDWKKVTEQQMKDWGVQYHELKFGKPAADFYIDDRAIPLESLYSAPSPTLP
jgi:CMP-N,N'-diacetyllegionaminic acid synthase